MVYRLQSWTEDRRPHASSPTRASSDLQAHLHTDAPRTCRVENQPGGSGVLRGDTNRTIDSNLSIADPSWPQSLDQLADLGDVGEAQQPLVDRRRDIDRTIRVLTNRSRPRLDDYRRVSEDRGLELRARAEP